MWISLNKLEGTLRTPINFVFIFFLLYIHYIKFWMMSKLKFWILHWSPRELLHVYKPSINIPMDKKLTLTQLKLIWYWNWLTWNSCNCHNHLLYSSFWNRTNFEKTFILYNNISLIHWERDILSYKLILMDENDFWNIEF